MTGGLSFLHWLAHLLVVSMDPAETSIRLKNCSKPIPIFPQAKHAHVTQDKYCHVCKVTM